MTDKNIRLIVDNHYEIVEVLINEIDKEYLLKLRDGYTTMLEVRNINSKFDTESLYVKLLQPESMLLVEIACRIELDELMPTKEEILSKTDTKFMDTLRHSNGM